LRKVRRRDYVTGMTLLLANVRPSDAEAALALGADIVDLNKTGGALAADAVRAIAGRRPVSATAGDLPMAPERLAAAVAAVAETGVQYVKVGLLPDAQRNASIARLAAPTRETKLVAVLFADRETDAGALPALLARLHAAGFAGAMLDTADQGARLLNHMDIPALSAFVDACRSNALMAGFAGALEAPDVPRLLPLAPDMLGFHRALYAGDGPTAPLDPAAFRMVRDLIPRASATDAETESADEHQNNTARDRIFVRDFVLPVRIGAYAHERDRLQRVRFTVDVAVRRPAHAIEDMRDVLSYDIVTDGIRMVAAQDDVALLETLAERIAGVVLAHARAAGVTVRVEKLDVGSGTVGVEIRRMRSATADARPLHSLVTGGEKAAE
jgi:(5-formylfuran-3-yl)methyl phosphate synthase